MYNLTRLTKWLLSLTAAIVLSACAGDSGGGGGGGSPAPRPTPAPLTDNCPGIPMSDQTDTDGDGMGDVCDLDADGDGFVEIRNATALSGLLRTNRSGNFELMGDIDLAVLNTTWQPLGTNATPFSGHLDGRNWTLAAVPSSGLFGVVRDATLRNLRLRVADLTASADLAPAYAGGLAQIAERTTIQDVYVVITGDVSARVTGNRSADVEAPAYAGGLVGVAINSNITNSYAEVTGTVQAHSNVSRALVGGLVGDAQNSFFNNTYAVVDGNLNAVSAAMHRNATAGGLVGFTNGETRLLHSYAVVRGNVSARQETDASLTTYAGALVGFFGSMGSLVLNDSYANASVLDANVTNVAADTHRTLAQLQCPTMPNATCQDAQRTYFGWDDQIWHFGNNLTLPTIRDVRMRDIDDDDVGDLDDNCVRVPNRNQANLDNATGDRLGDVCDDDIDGDGLANTADNCPRIASTNQTDLDNDGMGDLCDEDIDGDGVTNTADNCPRLANPNQAAGETCQDGDNDGITDTEDNCPRDANPDQANLDNATGDLLGDVCDNDIDGDGVPNTNNEDNCPRTPGVIANDGCPESFDRDGDGHPDNMDSCPDIFNPGAIPCTDTDGDRLADGADPCPTISDPSCQLISNTTALDSIPKNGAMGYYLVTANLTVNTSWASINNFGGVFNGSDYTIANLSAPLFGTISTGALVTRIGILGSTLANTNNGEISWTYATGNVNITSTRGDTGGLVRQNNGRISYSYATGNITSRSSGSTGGLAGVNIGTIVYSYATGDIRSTDLSKAAASGGLVGSHFGVINRSYVIGDVHSIGGTVGGLVGTNNIIGVNRGRVINSYATGNSSTSNANAGGLVGLYVTGEIITSYAAGRAIQPGTGSSGGLVGLLVGGSISSSYRAQLGSRSSSGGNRHRTLAQLRCPTYPGETCEGETTYPGWDNRTVWDFGDNATLPTIRGLPPCPSFLPNCRH